MVLWLHPILQYRLFLIKTRVIRNMKHQSPLHKHVSVITQIRKIAKQIWKCCCKPEVEILCQQLVNYDIADSWLPRQCENETIHYV